MSGSLAREAQDAVNFTNCAHGATHIPKDADRVGTILSCASVPALSPFPPDCQALSAPAAPRLFRGEIVALGIGNDKLLLPSLLAGLSEKRQKYFSVDLRVILPGSF